MSVQVVDPMDDVTRWTTVRPDGTSPSGQLTVVNDNETYGTGGDKVSTQLTADGDATGHALRRSLAAVDLTQFTELRLSIRMPRSRAATGGRFLLELTLGSAAVALGDPANRWHRLISVGAAARWETLHFSIDDLPASVAGAVTAIQFRCLQPSFVVNIDDIVAARPQLLIDCDDAVVAALNGIKVGDTPVSATVRAPEQALPGAPGLNIRHVDARYAPHRLIDAPARRDYTADGFRQVTAGTPYDLDYAISPVAASRSDQALLLEAVLNRLPANGELVVGGEPAPIQLVALPGADRLGGSAAEVPVLTYRIGARTPARVGPPVREVQVIRVSAETMVMS